MRRLPERALRLASLTDLARRGAARYAAHMELSNVLNRSLSPYLLQHAGNPVHWQEWHHDTLALARRSQRPILLSIGYSACHWCHVMARESFESDAVAERMNAHFINIKVDREERPDLDRIYQLSHQLLTGKGGGWPLTVFLDPDSQAPFFAGTYFPPEARHGLISFPELLQRIHEIWTTRRDELRAQHVQVQEALQAIAQPRPGDGSPAQAAEALRGQLAASFDREHGGFGTAPKFPQAPLLLALEDLVNLDQGADEDSERMLADSLEAMARFGLFDQLGGGFFRYATDAAWEIPHFEKMLSDNGLLLGLYARAARRWQSPRLKAVVEKTVGWLLGTMQLDNGAFAASLDADSAGSEGAFYLWTPTQVRSALPPEQARLFCARYGLDGPPNFDPGGDDPAWHLITARGLDELTDAERDRSAVAALLAAASEALRQRRAQGPAPTKDDKLIASWNGLVIASLAEAGRLLDRADWQAEAGRALDAVAIELFGHEPPRAVWRQGRSAQLANLEDHAALLLACLELLQWRFEPRWFNLARRIARRIERQFCDPETGAMYLTPAEQEPLLTRPLAFSDDATPAGAGLAVIGLLRLGHLCGDAALLRLAEHTLNAAGGDAERSPAGHATLIRAGLEAEQPRWQLLLGGPSDALQSVARAHPAVQRFVIPADTALDDWPPNLGALAAAEQPTAILCAGTRCLGPWHAAEDLEAALKAERPHPPGT
ncbi:MAG: thioredoxin domain-containing protein [Wenzhouxiangella sp.]